MKIVQKVWNIFTSLLVGVVVILALLLAGARLFGLQVYTVLSGSMEPVYHTGSLIYVKAVEPYTVEVGQDITFMLDEDTLATHRVMGIVPDEEDPTVLRYRTKGIANDTEDGTLVHYKNIVGTPVFTIPYLGYVSNYIQNPPGMYIAIAAGAMLVLLVFLPDLFAEEEEPVPKKKNKKRKTETSPQPARPMSLLEMGPEKVSRMLRYLDETDPERAAKMRRRLAAEIAEDKKARMNGMKKD